MHFEHCGAAGSALAALLLATALPPAFAVEKSPDAAAAYPVKAVRMVIPLAPGGGSDIVGRMLALALSETWGQSVVVDNRPGAGSTVGTALAVRAPADGYTVLVSSSSIAISPALYRNLDFDVRRDLAPVTLIASQPSILAVHASVSATTVRELVALARARPGKLAYASAGTGSATHLGAELLKYSAGIDLLHVPYKSAGQATAALLAGEAQVLITNMASVLPHAKSGRLKLLGLSSLQRSALAPELPTVAESGIAGFEYATWYGMLVPRAVPPAVIGRLHADSARALLSGAVRERFVAQGLDVLAAPPARFAAHLHAELSRWEKVIRAAGIPAE